MESLKVASTSDRLRECMREQKLKQVDILRMAEPLQKTFNINLNKGGLSEYISGKHEPDANRLFLLGYILNVSEAWLMGYDVPKERPGNRLDAEDVYNLNRVLDWIQYDASQRDLLDVIAKATEMLRK